MLRATAMARAGQWPAERATGAVTLDFASRHRRRLRLAADDGAAFLLDLAKPVALRDGDGLHLEDDSWIAVRAAPEAVVDITCADRRELMRVAWHLGNRHLPTQILDGALRIRDDHVIVDMVCGLGAEIRKHTAAFDPEGGAYGTGHVHG